MHWANISAWLLAIGLVAAPFAVIADLTDFLGRRAIRDLRAAAWTHGIGNAGALTLAKVPRDQTLEFAVSDFVAMN